MQKYLYRATYTHLDGSVAYEPVCVRADSEPAARADVDSATSRYAEGVKATKTLTLVIVTADS